MSAVLLQKLEIIRGYLSAGGWLMLPLALVTFAIWYQYLILRSRLKAVTNASEEAPPTTGASSAETDSGRNRPFEDLNQRMTRNVSCRMAAGLPFREAFAQCRQGELSPYDYSFYMLGALVAAAPLLGLLGTVLGMVDTFDGVASRSGRTAEVVAGGISLALTTTQVGLAAALPGTFGLTHLFRLYRRLQNRIDLLESALALKGGSTNCDHS
jgi:biopolymer transport protein ExbB